MTRRIFLWVAHPRQESLSTALAEAYGAGATGAGAEVRRQDLSEMHFSTAFEGYGPKRPPLEPDLVAWQENVQWADHIFIVHPYWWGAMPARAKSVLDRALTPGFGYKYHKTGLGWDKLLSGRTADVLITSDTPPLFDRLLYGMPGRNVMKNQVLGFCGIKCKTVRQIGPIKTAKPEKIDRWLKETKALGRTAALAKTSRQRMSITKAAQA